MANDRLTPEELAALEKRSQTVTAILMSDHTSPPPTDQDWREAIERQGRLLLTQADVARLFGHFRAQDAEIAVLRAALEEARPYVQREARLDIQDEHFYGREEVVAARRVLKNVNAALGVDDAD